MLTICKHNLGYENTHRPKEFGLWIDGAYVESVSAQYITRLSPAHDFPVTKIPEGTAGDVDRAVASDLASFESGIWASTSGAERSAVLYAVADRLIERKDELALLETLESGKLLTQAGFEVELAVGLWRHAAALCRHLYGESCNALGFGTISMTLRERIGVAAIITQWNFSLLIASQKTPYALAAGCSVVLKPFELTSATSLILA
jgi:betaine-aldehyde dehydrogenase